MHTTGVATIVCKGLLRMHQTAVQHMDRFREYTTTLPNSGKHPQAIRQPMQHIQVAQNPYLLTSPRLSGPVENSETLLRLVEPMRKATIPRGQHSCPLRHTTLSREGQVHTLPNRQAQVPLVRR